MTAACRQLHPHLARIPLAAILFIATGLGVVNTIGADDPLPGRFHFPSTKPDSSGSVSVYAEAKGTGDRPERWKARMVVNGVLTDAPWPEHPPGVWPIHKNVYLLVDLYSGRQDGYIWNATLKKLKPLGPCYVRPTEKFGLLVYRFPTAVPAAERLLEIIDFPTDTGEPRVLWSKKHVTDLRLLGVWDKGLLCMLNSKHLLVLAEGQKAKEFDIDLGEFHWQSGDDTIRGGRALVLGKMTPTKPFEDYTVAVGIVNLATKEVKQIGKIAGGWTNMTALPHPSVSARWITQAEAKKLPDVPQMPIVMGGGGAFVIEETDQIVQPTAKKKS